ncbi:MAG: homoserine kinase [Alphaproteobacteria bacterium]
MAVYTQVGETELSRFLEGYDIGAPVSFKGIAEGVENSNYLLVTERGRFILTLYEKRVSEADLPFFIGLMQHLAGRGIPCPLPIARRGGEAVAALAGRPAAIISFLEGLAITEPTPAHCRAVGAALGALHVAGSDFAMRRRNALGPSGWPALAAAIGKRGEEIAPGLSALTANEIAALRTVWPKDLPAGVIHADLFTDNVFFLDGKVSGLIDFYFACNDTYAYDIAIMLNAWCFAANATFSASRARELLVGYQAVRGLSKAELDALPALARGAALRFLLTRALDWLDTPKDALVRPKDPAEYLRKLEFHRTVLGPEGYGLDG